MGFINQLITGGAHIVGSHQGNVTNHGGCCRCPPGRGPQGPRACPRLQRGKRILHVTRRLRVSRTSFTIPAQEWFVSENRNRKPWIFPRNMMKYGIFLRIFPFINPRILSIYIYYNYIISYIYRVGLNKNNTFNVVFRG